MNQLTRSEKSGLLDEGLMMLASDHMNHYDYEDALDMYSKVQVAEAAFKQAQVTTNMVKNCIWY